MPGTKYLPGPHETTGMPCWSLTGAAAPLPRLGLIRPASRQQTHFLVI